MRSLKYSPIVRFPQAHFCLIYFDMSPASTAPLLPVYQSIIHAPDKAETEEVEEIRKLASSLAQLTGGESSAVLSLAKGYLALLDGKLAAARDALQQGEQRFSIC